MVYVFIGIGIVFFIAFTAFVSLSSFKNRQRIENMKEENAHRDLSEINPRSGQEVFKYRKR